MSGGAADLSALFDAFNRHDADAVMSRMTDDVVFETVAGPEVYGTQIVGREAVRAAFANVWKTLADAHWQTTSHRIDGDFGLSEWVFSGTDATGSRIEAEGCDLFTFKDGMIALKRAFRKPRPPFPA